MSTATVLKILLAGLLSALAVTGAMLMVLAARLRLTKKALERVRHQRDDFQSRYWREVNGGGAE